MLASTVRPRIVRPQGIGGKTQLWVCRCRESKLKIYVGNMPYSVTSEELTELFGQHGHVSEANVIVDFESGRSKGFGFVEMPNDSEANEAINALNSSQLSGRTLRVSQARPRQDRGNRGWRR